MHAIRSNGSRRMAMTVLAICLVVRAAHAEAVPVADRLGEKIANVTLEAGTAEPVRLHDVKAKQATVVVFLSFECPVSNSYAESLAEMHRAYEGRGVSFLGVCVNEDLGSGALRKHVEDFKLTFPVYRDRRNALANAFGASVTPEAFVVDAGHVLRYRGRIDNAYSARLRKNNAPLSSDLRKALDEVVAGKPVSTPSTSAVGCPIHRPDAKPALTEVTYYRDVAPILQNHCQVCHRPGEVGPFALMTYRQAVNWADDLKAYTRDRRMPPWKPSDGPAFHHERKLSEQEIATLAAWADGGTPAGDPKDAPPPVRFPEGWRLGKPDLVLTVPAEFHLGATGKDLFRCFALPTGLDADKFVTAIEVKPGNPRVVHHALLFVDGSGQARQLEAKEQARGASDADKDRGPGYSVSMGVGFVPQGGLGGWAPGQLARQLAEGTAYYLPKGSDVVLQVHYHRDGRDENDRTSIGLYFAKQPVAKRFQGLAVPGRFFMIPAGAASHRVTGAITVQQDCELHSVTPHMHMLGKEIKLTMIPPTGPSRTLIAIKEWDYNWQESYVFKEAIPVKAGTVLEVEAVYDNSGTNPRNPNDPPKPVFLGRETTNEMCFVFLGATADQPGRIRIKQGKDVKEADSAK